MCEQVLRARVVRRILQLRRREVGGGGEEDGIIGNGLPALIEDLDRRGMLDATLVCNLAEFGRTPRVNPAGGRDHWPGCFTVGFAGGGVKGGRIVGASDPIGATPADRPVGPPEVVATIFHSLGLDLEAELPGPGGRPFALVDPGHREIHELF